MSSGRVGTLLGLDPGGHPITSWSDRLPSLPPCISSTIGRVFLAIDSDPRGLAQVVTRATEGSKRCTQKSEVGRDSVRNGSRFFSKKMANATKVLFKYAFAQCFRSYVLLKLFDIYKLFYNFKKIRIFYRTIETESPSISAFVLQW